MKGKRKTQFHFGTLSELLQHAHILRNGMHARKPMMHIVIAKPITLSKVKRISAPPMTAAVVGVFGGRP
jgi:hypothetical protein